MKYAVDDLKRMRRAITVMHSGDLPHYGDTGILELTRMLATESFLVTYMANGTTADELEAAIPESERWRL
jgi:hypothetical protein